MRRFFAIAVVLLAAPGARAQEPEFARHISPMLYQLGCSAGTCHGSFSGKGGFRLSLFAGSPEMDYQNIRGTLNRRLDAQDPERSLLVLKPTGQLDHGGAVKLRRGSWQYDLLVRWIRNGARYQPDKDTRVLSIRVEPASLVFPTSSATLKVIAKLSNGQEDDVTRFTRFESLDPSTAEVDASGSITPKLPGDTSVLAHYAGQVGFTTVLVPHAANAKLKSPAQTVHDPVDKLLLGRMAKLNIVPSPVCDDLTFLRRVYLDVIGQLPTPDEIRAFQSDKAANKRAKVIDRLLAHPLHAATWAGRMCDMTGADDRFLADGVYQFHDWFRNKLEANWPWDKIAYGVICATAADGRDPQQILADQKRDTDERKLLKELQKKDKNAKLPIDPSKKPWQIGYGTRNTLDFFHSNLIHVQEIPGKPRIIDSKKVALRVATTFLGVRLECAQCHKHPNDRWSQADFFGFSMNFAHTHIGGVDPALKAAKVNLAGVHVQTTPAETMLDPETQQPLKARILGGADIEVKDGVDPRKELWKWMTSKDNPYFARAIVNRTWAFYLGRGFIEPPDSQAAANPPTHPEVLDELARDFIAHKFDLRHLHRRILNTLAYQRDWRTNASNAKDERNFSHRLLRRLNAEQAVDAIAQATGTEPKFAKRFGTPRTGIKAAELALSRMGGDDAYVLQIFGRPLRVQNCDCERSAAASLSQTLYLFNDEKLLAKIHDPKGRLQGLVAKTSDDRKLLAELYLWTLTRYPTDAEVERSVKHVRQAASRLEGYQDVLWSLLNRHDFVVNH
ncbi:MAG TPA: DUF1549 and DUF1553 domain-containing protein [Gemmataceae bacterium]|nr:DUF1549 and DUF1553 domain-containing protein [Gemmataceae bacterium]